MTEAGKPCRVTWCFTTSFSSHIPHFSSRPWFPQQETTPLDSSSAYAARRGEVPQHRREGRSCTQWHSPSTRLPVTHHLHQPQDGSKPEIDCVMLPSSFDFLLFTHLSHRVHKHQGHQGHGSVALGFSLKLSGASGEWGSAASALPPAANHKCRSPRFPLKAEGFIYF